MKFASMIALLLCPFTAYAQTPTPYPDIQGKILKEIKYTDQTGDNVIVLTQTDIITQKCDYADECRNQDIYAYRFLLNQGKPQQMWQIRDFMHDCDLDAFFTKFRLDSVSITDLNNNNLKEVWIPYQTFCSGDPAPIPSKIIAYEGTQKYALRGETREIVAFDAENNRHEYAGGTYQMDNALQNNPTFNRFAKTLWEKINSHTNNAVAQ